MYWRVDKFLQEICSDCSSMPSPIPNMHYAPAEPEMSPLRASRGRCTAPLPTIPPYTSHMPNSHQPAETSITSSVSSPSVVHSQHHPEYKQMREVATNGYGYEAQPPRSDCAAYYHEEYNRPSMIASMEKLSHGPPPLPAVSHLQATQSHSAAAPLSSIPDGEYYNPGFIRILPRTASLPNRFRKACETCGAEHDGTFGAGRFCSSRCARTVGGLAHRKKRLAERGMIADAAAVQLPPASYSIPPFEYRHIPPRPLSSSITKRPPSYQHDRVYSETGAIRYRPQSRMSINCTSMPTKSSSRYISSAPPLPSPMNNPRLTAEPSKLQPLSLPRADVPQAHFLASDGYYDAAGEMDSSSRQTDLQTSSIEASAGLASSGLPTSPLTPIGELSSIQANKSNGADTSRSMSLAALLNPST